MHRSPTRHTRACWTYTNWRWIHATMLFTGLLFVYAMRVNLSGKA